MEDNNFWNDRELAQKTNSEHTRKKEKLDKWKKLDRKVRDSLELAELAIAEDDETTVREIEQDFIAIATECKTSEISTLLNGQYDACNAIFSIHAGAGGTEAQDWADMLSRMYMRWMERHNFKFDVVDSTPGEEAGIKSIVIEVKGENVYGLLTAEKGIHRLVRISPFDANKRRHTSFAAAEIIPEIEDVSIEINPDDLKIDTYRASGAGGQHVNKTSSAIRITHIPTGIVVQCQNERSQFKNKDMAMKILRARIFEQRRREQEAKISNIQGEQKDIAWGSQIRSYVFHPYSMVKDLRSGYKVGNVQGVMDGDIDDFIWEYLKFKATGKRASDDIDDED